MNLMKLFLISCLLAVASIVPAFADDDSAAPPQLAGSRAPEPNPAPPGAEPSSAPTAEPSASMTDVPAIDASPTEDSTATLAPPPPINLLSGKEATLTSQEKNEVRLANDWKGAPFQPGSGDNGRVVFRFGATLPTVVCAPLYVCAIELELGETVNAMNIGDSVRWSVTPAMSGSGAGQTTNVVVKPSDTNLVTNMVISTDRRTYVIKLVSRRNDWMPFVSFSYPENEEAQWKALSLYQQKQKAATILPVTGQNIDSLDFNYKLTGDTSKAQWTPLRVYTDGIKTYIQFPPSMKHGDAPALLALADDGGIFSGPTKELVNYRVLGDRYVVDKVLAHAALISGVGSSQVKVVITRVSEARDETIGFPRRCAVRYDTDRLCAPNSERLDCNERTFHPPMPKPSPRPWLVIYRMPCRPQPVPCRSGHRPTRVMSLLRQH